MCTMVAGLGFLDTWADTPQTYGLVLACGPLDGHVQKMIFRAREHESEFVVVDTF